MDLAVFPAIVQRTRPDLVAPLSVSAYRDSRISDQRFVRGTIWTALNKSASPKAPRRDATNDTDTDNTPQPQFGTADAFTAAMTLLAVAADPRVTEKRLRKIAREQAALDAARADLLQQSTSFREETSTKQSELETLEKDARAREVAAYAAEQDLVRREAGLAQREQKLTERDGRLKRRTMLLAGIEEPGPLQDRPTWRQIGNELLQIDPHFPVAPDLETETVTERPDFAPAHSTLTRTHHRALTRSRRAATAMEA
jgi:hypothetical protein